jgi:transcriptional regulator with XRE-family HTH domain
VTPEEQEVAEAIKSLREELGESQQAFSNRIGVVVRTVARWELEKPPIGDVLLRLFEISQDAGREDLVQVFAKALNTLPPKVLLESIRSTIWPVMMHNIKAWAQMDEALCSLEKTAASAKSKPEDYRTQIAVLRKQLDETRKQTAHLAALVGIDTKDFLHDSSSGRQRKTAKADE